MKRKKLFSLKLEKPLLLIVTFLILSYVGYSYFTQDNDVDEIVEKTAVRLANYPQLTDWQVSVLSTSFRMDKNWQPQKETVVKKIVTIRGEERTEDIISAVENEKGKNKDVTEKFRKEALKEKKKREERRAEGKTEEEGSRRELSMDDMFPFGVTARQNYIFTLREDSELESIPVFILETRAKMRTDKYYEGKYYIDKNDYNILKVELKPAKNPSVLKLFEMEAYFQIIPGGYFVLKKTKVRIQVGLVVKNIRLDAEEVYSGYLVLSE